MAKILIIEDNHDICEMYRLALMQEGFTVLEENDGIKGLTTAVAENPDLIILDVMMPQMDGFEVLKALRQNTSLGSKIVINSNSETRQDEEKALALGADKYLKKSMVTPKILVEQVQKLLSASSVLSYASKPKILIIEDNQDICEMYKIALEAQGFIVEIEMNGINGVTKAVEQKPHLIVLDIMMPQMDGFEVLRALRQHTTLDCKILVNSNLNNKGDEDKALELGADKYLRKSDFTPKQLVETVSQMLGRG